MTAHPVDTAGPVVVTLLTQPDCAMCVQAKEILARTGSEGLTTVDEVDLHTETGRTLALRHGVMFAPGVLVADQPFSFGRLSEKKLRRRLQQLASPQPAPPPGHSGGKPAGG